LTVFGLKHKSRKVYKGELVEQIRQLHFHMQIMTIDKTLNRDFKVQIKTWILFLLSLEGLFNTFGKVQQSFETFRIRSRVDGDHRFTFWNYLWQLCDRRHVHGMHFSWLAPVWVQVWVLRFESGLSSEVFPVEGSLLFPVSTISTSASLGGLTIFLFGLNSSRKNLLNVRLTLVVPRGIPDERFWRITLTWIWFVSFWHCRQ